MQHKPIVNAAKVRDTLVIAVCALLLAGALAVVGVLIVKQLSSAPHREDPVWSLKTSEVPGCRPSDEGSASVGREASCFDAVERARCKAKPETVAEAREALQTRRKEDNGETEDTQEAAEGTVRDQERSKAQACAWVNRWDNPR